MKERRKIEVKKKKIRRCIFALWCILAIIFLIAVNIYNGNEKAENVISDLVRIYIGASFIIIGIIYKLGTINNRNFQKGRRFRSIPLTPQAQEIITKTLKLNPDCDFLFMKDGQPIYADSFNEHLKNKVCKPLNIPYRSSHQIRFTITTMLYEAGVPLNQLSTMLGHSETRTTLHYIRQQSVDPKSSTIMINTLDTDLSDSNPANP